MSTYYLVPTSISYMSIHGNLQDFNVLYLKFSENMGDYSETDRVIPSSNGTDAGLPQGFEYSVLGWNTISRIGYSANNLVITDPDNSTHTITIRRIYENADTFSFVHYSSYAGSLMSIGFYGPNYYYAAGLVVAEFADGKYTIGAINNGFNPNNPPNYRTLTEPTNNSFGYMLIDVNPSLGYAQVSFAGLGFSQYYQEAAEIFVKNSVPQYADPYAPGGTSTDGGGDGDYDGTSDYISEPSYDTFTLRDRGYIGNGFVRSYYLTSVQLTDLHNYLWSSSITDILKKLYSNPMDCIISLALIPIPALVTEGESPTGVVGNILIANTDTEISSIRPLYQFVDVDCGSIDLNEFWGSYLDYDPYTSLSIYLPYIGYRKLNIDDFMNGTISVKYRIDIVSGDCVAFISKTGARSNAVVTDPEILGVLYQFNGNCALSIPISAADYTTYRKGQIGQAAATSTMVAGLASGNVAMAEMGLAATATAYLNTKRRIDKVGSIPSTPSYMGVQKPYLILERPFQCLPESQNIYTGYPSYITKKVSDLSGFTRFQVIHLENMYATDEEKNELEEILRRGVLL